MKARILLKADAGEGGEAWSDSRIAKALDTSLATIAPARQQLVEGGFESVLTRKHSRPAPRSWLEWKTGWRSSICSPGTATWWRILPTLQPQPCPISRCG
jgi:hypothetical protein